jgi:glycogen debranching enzyme
LIKPFIIARDNSWADLIQIDSGQVNQISSSSFSVFLATYWSSGNFYNRSPDVIVNLNNNELIGKSGIRSMSPHSPEYNSEHEYLLPDSPAGTKSAGDILVWSSGLLADTYWNVGAFDEIRNLLDELTRRVLYQGVTGGLPEAEQPESDNILESSVGNTIFLASNAEYLRIIENRVLSIHIFNENYLSIQPDFPESWGETEIVLKNEFGQVILHKMHPLLYRVSQVGISPYIELSLRIKFSIPGKEGGALTSARIYPNEETFIHFETNKDGIWVGREERD